MWGTTNDTHWTRFYLTHNFRQQIINLLFGSLRIENSDRFHVWSQIYFTGNIALIWTWYILNVSKTETANINIFIETYYKSISTSTYYSCDSTIFFECFMFQYFFDAFSFHQIEQGMNERTSNISFWISCSQFEHSSNCCCIAIAIAIAIIRIWLDTLHSTYPTVRERQFILLHSSTLTVLLVSKFTICVGVLSFYQYYWEQL